METKICNKCGKTLPVSMFKERKFKSGNVGLRSRCNPCEKEDNKLYYESRREFLKEQARIYYENNREDCLKRRHKYVENNIDKVRERDRDYYRNHYETRLVGAARARAKKKGLEFNITKDDITIPSECPLLGIAINVSDGKAMSNSASIDRIDSNKGYTKDNVWVVSHKANTIKSNATLEELELLVKNLRNKIEEI